MDIVYGAVNTMLRVDGTSDCLRARARASVSSYSG